MLHPGYVELFNVKFLKELAWKSGDAVNIECVLQNLLTHHDLFNVELVRIQEISTKN